MRDVIEGITPVNVALYKIGLLNVGLFKGANNVNASLVNKDIGLSKSEVLLTLDNPIKFCVIPDTFPINVQLFNIALLIGAKLLIDCIILFILYCKFLYVVLSKLVNPDIVPIYLPCIRLVVIYIFYKYI